MTDQSRGENIKDIILYKIHTKILTQKFSAVSNVLQ